MTTNDVKGTNVTSTPSRWHRRKAALLRRFALSAVTAALVTAGPATAAYTPWTSSSVVGPGTAFRDAAAVVVGPTVEDLLWVAENGSVQQETHYQGIGWFANQVAPAGSADPYADIADVARGGGSGVGADVDVFWFGPQGSIQQEVPATREVRITGTRSWRPRAAQRSPQAWRPSRARRRAGIFWTEANGGIEDAYHYDRGPSGLSARGTRQLEPDVPAAADRRGVAGGEHLFSRWWRRCTGLPAPSGTEPSRLAAAVRLRLREPPARD